MAYSPNATLPDSQEGILQARRTRVLIEAATATNMSVNCNQFQGQAVGVGLGVSTTGSIRVCPSNDTQAGLPVSIVPSNLSIIYSNITVS
jgi:hypothetical protein